MNPLDQARERIRILGEVLEVTPAPDHGPADLSSLGQILQLRQNLLDQLPPLPPTQEEDREIADLIAKSKELVNEILQRDSVILSSLVEARRKVQHLLQQVGAPARHEPSIFRGTA